MEKGLSDNSLRRTAWTQNFAIWLAEARPESSLTDVTRLDLLEYIECRSKAGIKPRSAARALSAARVLPNSNPRVSDDGKSDAANRVTQDRAALPQSLTEDDVLSCSSAGCDIELWVAG